MKQIIFRHSSPPLYALTMGDPAGIGPEIAVKALRHEHFRRSVLVVGDSTVLADTAQKMGSPLEINRIESSDNFIQDAINVLDCNYVHPGMFEIGQSQRICGEASFHYIERAIALALDGDVCGVITNPISKKSLAMAKIPYPGHTEIFADKTGTTDFSMLFMLKNVVVAHVTTHCSLRNALDQVTTEKILKTIELLNTALKELGFKIPRIAVGGLNPHAGENGLFGNEEETDIIPAINSARKAGIAATGPYPPDTVFMRAFRGEFDGIAAMLHDHGFVALKSMDFEHGVNITTGLPIIRTSVGHGTAFEIAGKYCCASEESLLAAHDAAVKIFTARYRNA